MQIFYNETQIETEFRTLEEFRQQHKAGADVMIVNGYPAPANYQLSVNDRITLIRRGEQPSQEELEFLMAARHTPGVHQQVKRGCVGIAGAGGLGSQVAVALARVGVGTLVIADFDIVEPSNLNRQQYFIDQIGLPKVEALRANLQRINPWTRVTSYQIRISPDNLLDIFATTDVLIEAFDDPGQKAMLATHWLQHCPDIPLIAASGMAGFATSNSITTRRTGRNFYLCGDGSSAALPGHGLMAPRVGIVAHHQANAALRLLLGEDPAATSNTDNRNTSYADQT